MKADGTPWWVSSGPPTKDEPTVAEQIVAENSAPPSAPKVETSEEPKVSHSDANAKDSASHSTFFGIDPEMQSAALATGLGLLTSVMDLIAKPSSGEEQQSTHDPETCGVCPLCVAVSALREHDAGLADLVQSAMSGVTGSMEKLSHAFPDVADKISEALVTAAVKALLKRN
jgi:hypothetical protein